MLSSLLSAPLGAVLVAAAIPKLLRPEEFLNSVRGFRLLPTRIEAPVARAIPSTELLVGLLLLVGIGRAAAALVAAALFLSFTLALLINVVRGNVELDCGCFGFADPDRNERIGPVHVLRAAALTAAGVVVALLPQPNTAEHLTIAAIVVVLAGLAFAVRQVLAVMTLGTDSLDSHLDNASNRYRSALAARTAR